MEGAERGGGGIRPAGSPIAWGMNTHLVNAQTIQLSGRTHTVEIAKIFPQYPLGSFYNNLLLQDDTKTTELISTRFVRTMGHKGRKNPFNFLLVTKSLMFSLSFRICTSWKPI